MHADAALSPAQPAAPTTAHVLPDFDDDATYDAWLDAQADPDLTPDHLTAA